MARLTPIERAIAGPPPDRRRRWEQKMADRGFKRMTLYVREPQVPVVEALKLALRDMDPEDLSMHQDALYEFFNSCAENMDEELWRDPSLGETTSIEAEIAVYRAAAAATKRIERSEGGRGGSSASDAQQ